MKTIAYRASGILLVLVVGVSLSGLLLFAGDKSKGPLEDLAASIANQVAHFEKNIVDGDVPRGRSAALGWFRQYRNSNSLLNAPDTVLTGVYDNNTDQSYESVVDLEDSLGLKLPLIHFYTAWGSKKEQAFPTLRAQAIRDLGSVPIITWEPWLDDFDPALFPAHGDPKRVNVGGMKAVAQGKYDAYLDKWAQEAKAFGGPFFLRFGHEMNDPYRYPWGPQNNKPSDFIAAWRHVVTRFRQQGVTNARWVWSPHPAYANFPEFYPGNAYVDWIGVTVLNYGTVAPWSKWYSFEEIIGKTYAKVSLYGKPLMITELGCLSVGGNRAAWYQDALSTLPTRFPAVKAVLFFNNSLDVSTTYKALDWSLNADSASLKTISQSLKKWRMARPHAL